MGEAVILLLERLDDMKKAKLVGRAFRGFCKGYIDIESLQRINYTLDRVMLRDLSKLPDFYLGKSPIDHITRQAFVNAELAYIPGGYATTDVRINKELSRDLIKYVLKKDLLE